jgi:RHS repeat-associated protein
MTNDTAHTYAYDAEGHVVSISTNGTTTLTESYNALGWRVEAINCCGTVDYVHDAAGNMVGGAANSGPGRSEQYIYFRGGLLAQYWNGQGLWFAHINGLGSTQQFTDYTGGHPNDSLFYPFGQLGPQGSGAYFESLWSGFEDGDFWATSEWQTDTRRYTPGLGRWYTPDPAGKGAARLDFPQTWNMYTYVQNNPTTLTDPSGEFNLLTPLLEAVTSFVSEALDAGSYLVKDVTRSKPQPPATRTVAVGALDKPHAYAFTPGITQQDVLWSAKLMKGDEIVDNLPKATISLTETKGKGNDKDMAICNPCTDVGTLVDTQHVSAVGLSQTVNQSFTINNRAVGAIVIQSDGTIVAQGSTIEVTVTDSGSTFKGH